MNGRDKVKVLIIEDSEYKLEDAIQTLQKLGITDYVHVNNYLQAVDICFRKKKLDEFDFIILDIQFYEYRAVDTFRTIPDQQAGYKFLYQLASKKASKPVFIFSSVTDYLKEYNDFLFPSFEEYSKHFSRGSQPFMFTRISEQKSRYDEMKKENSEILERSGFVVGHAHNKYELHSLIKTFLDSNNQG